MDHLGAIYYPYFAVANFLALLEKAFDLPPCKLVKAVFPIDKYQYFVRDALNDTFWQTLEQALLKDMPRANWLPSLEAVGKLFK